MYFNTMDLPSRINSSHIIHRPGLAWGSAPIPVW